jgi:hypothetical protein
MVWISKKDNGAYWKGLVVAIVSGVVDLLIVFLLLPLPLLPLTPYNAGLIAFKSNDSSKDSRYDFACKDDDDDGDVLVFDDGCEC